MSTLEVDADPKHAVRAIVAEARRAVEADHAEVICLGVRAWPAWRRQSPLSWECLSSTG